MNDDIIFGLLFGAGVTMVCGFIAFTFFIDDDPPPPSQLVVVDIDDDTYACELDSLTDDDPALRCIKIIKDHELPEPPEEP